MPPWDIAGSLQASELNQRKIQATDVEAAGQAAAGNALMSLFNGGVPRAQPMPPQGAAPMARPPMGQSPMPAPQMRAPQMTPGAPAPSPQPAQAQVPGAQPMMPQAPAGASSPMPAPGPPPGGVAQPPGGNQPQLDWRTVIQHVVRANPGVKDPRVIAAAVDRFMPIMNQQSQMEWRNVGLQLRQQSEDIARQRLELQRQQGDVRTQQGQERIDVSKEREQRLTVSTAVRQDQAYQRLQLARQQLERQITQGNQRQLLGQWRAVLDAQHKRAQEIIASQAAGMSDAERKKLLADEDKAYTDAIKSMRDGKAPGSFDDRFAPEGGAQPAATGAPAAPKPGDVRDGWRFKGGDPGKQESWEKVPSAAAQ